MVAPIARSTPVTLAYDAASGHLFAGGSFTNAGANANADVLAPGAKIAVMLRA